MCGWLWCRLHGRPDQALTVDIIGHLFEREFAATASSNVLFRSQAKVSRRDYYSIPHSGARRLRPLTPPSCHSGLRRFLLEQHGSRPDRGPHRLRT